MSSKPIDLIGNHIESGIKTYSSYDGSGRLEYFYTAATDAVNGQKCLVTQYVYDGATARVLKTKESLSTWDSSWDV